MQKYYTTKEDKDGDYVTVDHTRYTVTEIDPARVHIPAGREADIDLYDSQAEFLESMGLSPVEGHVFPEPEPFPAVAPVVPDVVDMWKLKAVLDIVGKTAMIETVIAGIPDEDTRVATQAGWKHASTIERGHSLVQAMIAIPSLDIDEEDMDEYFLATKQYDK